MPETPATPGGLPVLDKINTVLGQVVPGLGLVLALADLGRELLTRKATDQPELTLAEMGAYLETRGQAMQDFSASWLAAHGYDAHGHKQP